MVAVAEPQEVRRRRFAARHGLGDGAAVAAWQELAGRGRVADAVLICTQDAVHADPAVAFAELGYHVLLEKPMATTEADCRRIVGAVERAGVILSVCHVLRYTPPAATGGPACSAPTASWRVTARGSGSATSSPAPPRPWRPWPPETPPPAAATARRLGPDGHLHPRRGHGDRAHVLTGPRASLEAHLVVFAAERGPPRGRGRHRSPEGHPG